MMRVAPMESSETKNDPTPSKGRKIKKRQGGSVMVEPQVVSPDISKSQTETMQDPTNNLEQDQEKISASAQLTSKPNEDESSNDDSSYFADPDHRPDPKSDRRFSWSSVNSAPQASPPLALKSNGRESDASLSLSDDSDGDEIALHSKSATKASFHPTNPRGFFSVNSQFASPFAGTQPGTDPYQHGAMQQTTEQRPDNTETGPPISQTGVGVPELYPQQITRMHSVSSLVSTSSQNSTASDTSVQDELKDLETHYHSQKIDIPSGRLSPVLGEHPPSRNQNMLFASPSTINPGPSPPTILQASSLPPGSYLQPQPHLMTPEQLAAWKAWMKATNSLTVPHPIPASANVSSGGGYSIDNQIGPKADRDYMLGTEMNDAPTPSRRGSDRVSRKGPGPFRGDRRKTRHATEFSQQEKVNRDVSRQEENPSCHQSDRGFKVYWQRWIMLFYMSLLNLLSDWTCYSVAPIALLTEEAFGAINAEQLVTIFLVANAIASACEPMILARLGLRRTVLFGALLLMIGSVVKSGGMPPIIKSDLQKGHGEWKVYLGFFIVGLSQPLYQCTPALLSASWFPEAERTMATGVALNANQIGIGFAFIFGTLLVANSDDIPDYFGILSIISTLAFLGTLIQFSDAPPTPPSETAKVVRGTLVVNLPAVSDFFDSVRNIGQVSNPLQPNQTQQTLEQNAVERHPPSDMAPSGGDFSNLVPGPKSSVDESSRRRRILSTSKQDRIARRRRQGQESMRASENTSRTGIEDNGFHGLAQQASNPSPAPWDCVVGRKCIGDYQEIGDAIVPAPSPMMQGTIERNSSLNESEHDEDQDVHCTTENLAERTTFPQYGPSSYLPPYGFPYISGNIGNLPLPERGTEQQHLSPYHGYTHLGYPFMPPGFHQYASYYQQQAYQRGFYIAPMQPVDLYHYYYSYQHALPPPPHMRGYEDAEAVLPPSGLDEGAEPVLTITPHNLDINIRDDQIILSLKACMSRPGFIHSLVAFTVSGIVINTLSTFMDYLVRLNGVGREYTGIVGGSFQVVIMISSLIVGQLCDKTRAYYSITIGMLVMGAFGLAECGVSLDADRGTELRWALVIVAALVGPLQPVSTELGVDVVYPLSENTVLVIQQLFSNLLSAAFIPCFKAMRDIGRGIAVDGVTEKPQYTFSFYLLIVLHAISTVFFATFNGRYLRYEHEQDKLAEEERRKVAKAARAFQPPELFHQDERDEMSSLLHSED